MLASEPDFLGTAGGAVDKFDAGSLVVVTTGLAVVVDGFGDVTGDRVVGVETVVVTKALDLPEAFEVVDGLAVVVDTDGLGVVGFFVVIVDLTVVMRERGVVEVIGMLDLEVVTALLIGIGSNVLTGSF